MHTQSGVNSSSGWTQARVDAAVRERADIAGHASLRGFVPHIVEISCYLDDRSNVRGTRMVTKVRLGSSGDSGSYAAGHLPGPCDGNNWES